MGVQRRRTRAPVSGDSTALVPGHGVRAGARRSARRFPSRCAGLPPRPSHPARSSGVLYALNTVGAAVGALARRASCSSPRSDCRGRRWSVSPRAACGARPRACATPQQAERRVHAAPGGSVAPRASRVRPTRRPDAGPTRRSNPDPEPGTWNPGTPDRWRLPCLGCLGFAALVHEIAWTRILALVLGPTIYAFAATLAAVIARRRDRVGAGTWTRRTHTAARDLARDDARRARRSTASYTYSLAGAQIPRLVAQQMASSRTCSPSVLQQGLLLTAALDPADRRVPRRGVSARAWRSSAPARIDVAGPLRESSTPSTRSAPSRDRWPRASLHSRSSACKRR